MKKFILFFAIITLCNCSGINNRPDKRDKYVGEYKLLLYQEWFGYERGYNWNYYTNSYDYEWYSHKYTDTAKTLIVKKNLTDTTTLTFYVVKPFDFAYAESIKLENEKIKQRNAESICGEDEKLYEVPIPTYDDTRDLVQTFYAYVEGHKIFISDYTKLNYYPFTYDPKFWFDSVYLSNDTLRFKLTQNWNFDYRDTNRNCRIMKERFIAVKENVSE